MLLRQSLGTLDTATFDGSGIVRRFEFVVTIREPVLFWVEIETNALSSLRLSCL